MSAADLRIAQGQVRCGRCLAVFNALLALYDDLPSRKSSNAAAAANAAPIAGETLAATAVEPTAVLTPEPEQAPAWAPPQQAQPTSDETPQTLHADVRSDQDTADPTPTDVQAAFDRPAVAIDAVAIDAVAIDAVAIDVVAIDVVAIDVVAIDAVAIDEYASTIIAAGPNTDAGDSAEAFALPPVANDALVDELPAANDPYIAELSPSTNDPLIEDLAITEPRVLIPDRTDDARSIDLGAAEHEPQYDPQYNYEPLFQRADTAVDASLEDAASEDGTEREPMAAVERAEATVPRRSVWRWASAVLSLLLLLIGQLVHAKREEIATRDGVGAPLRAFYEKLGLPISPRWDVHVYEVRQQGAVGAADAGAPLTVRASIANRGLHAQPLPLLRVTLQDRFGNRVAQRDLQSREYIPRSRIGPWLMPGQRVDAEVALADPGGKAVGFEIDACLQLVPGRYTCANERPTATR